MNSSIYVLVCDDEQSSINGVTGLFNASGFNVNVIPFAESRKALEYVCSGAPVDVCFLDIIMPEMNGITLAEKMRSAGYRGDIVFLSGSNAFASESYRVKARDYILKPPAPNRVRDILASLENARKKNGRGGITVKSQKAVMFIPFGDISHVEVIKHTVHIRFADGGEVNVHSPFREMAAELLKDPRFIQCHRSFLINMNDVKTVTNTHIVMHNCAKIPVSRSFSKTKNTLIEKMLTKTQ